MNKCLKLLLGFSLILGSVNSDEEINWESQYGHQWRNVSQDTFQNRIGAKGDEYVCSNSGFLSKVVNFLLPKAKKPPKDAKIILQLFVKYGGEILETRIAENGKIINHGISKFRPEEKTVIIVHGFQGDMKDPWMHSMAQAYLNYDHSVNVIIVDWSILSKTINYAQAAANIISVGEQVNELLVDIRAAVKKEMGCIQWGSIHMIGFSLGAHVVGIISHRLKKSQIPWHVDRITGLDPAHPCITHTNNSLDKSDAPFVDVIHTNGNKAFGVTLGMMHNIGHVDFYVNGGQRQPGCGKTLFRVWSSISDLAQIPLEIKDAICSHSRAPEYFIESLEVAASGIAANLTGIQWDGNVCKAMEYTYNRICKRGCQQMGINANTANPGMFFVPTATKKPYYDIREADRKKITEELERTLD